MPPQTMKAYSTNNQSSREILNLTVHLLKSTRDQMQRLDNMPIIIVTPKDRFASKLSSIA